MQASPAPTERPSRLDTETIVRVACELADREGASAVTMRRLGAVLGVDPTAVYRHFRSKQHLLDAMADHLFEELLGELERTDDPRSNLRELMVRGFRLYQAHPGLAVALARQRDDTSALARLSDLVIAELRAVGLSESESAWAYHTVVDVVVGSGLFFSVAPELADAAERAAMRRAFSALPPETHPDVVAVATHLYPDADEAFRFTVELLLDAFELRAAGASAKTKEEAG